MNTFTISSRWENAYGFKSNYNWFPNTVINNTDTFEVDKVKEDFFTMCMPTGTGKSGETYKAIVNYINNAFANDKRIIINISSPLLKLNQQLSLDMIFSLLELYNNKTSPLYNNFINKSVFFFNSSESITTYPLFRENKNGKVKNTICTGEIPPYNFINDFDNMFIKDESKRIAIVCSCHKSLNKFIKYISDNKLKDKNIEIRNFLDESHTISDRSFAVDDSTKVDIKELCKYSTGVISISATPDIKITEIINGFSKEYKSLSELDDPYAVHVYPKDAINIRKILRPQIDLWRCSCTEINDKIISEIYDDSHTKNPTVQYQKILVNCPCGDNGDDSKIKSIYVKLRKKYSNEIKNNKLRIYCTSCRTNFLCTLDDKKIKTMKEFTSSIDNAECDCIILHIKQMIAGIDISSITQTVMYLSDIKEDTMRVIIQTCGRCLRIGKGDRNGKYAKSIDQCKKKFGLCTFIISEDDNETEEKLRTFFIRYYMLDNIKFKKSYSINTGNNDMIGHPMPFRNSKKYKFENLQFTIDFHNYITENKDILKRHLKLLSEDKVICRSELIKMLNNNNNSHLFDNREIVKIIKKELFTLK